MHDAQKAIKNHLFAFEILLIVVRAYETTKQRNYEIPANRATARLFVYRSVGPNQPLEFRAGHLPSFVILAHVRHQDGSSLDLVLLDVRIDRHVAHLRQLEVHAWLSAVSQLLRLQELNPNESSVTVAHVHNRKK